MTIPLLFLRLDLATFILLVRLSIVLARLRIGNLL